METPNEQANTSEDDTPSSVAYDKDEGKDDDTKCCIHLRHLLWGSGGPLPTDYESGKAKELRILSFARPHMRAFHFSWISFFVSFFVWFSIVALLPYMQESLDLTDNDIWISNIFNLIPLERLLVGPLTDRFGPRKMFLVILCFAAIPTALTGLVNNAAGLWVLRLFIGVAGGSFVVCQYWSTAMFAPEIVGQANGIVGGWGNLGGGVTQLVIGTGLMPLFIRCGVPTETAWKTISLIPAAMAVLTAFVVYFFSDDAPTRKKHRRSTITQSVIKKNPMEERKANVSEAFLSAAIKPATWILCFHYMVSFGVELTMLGAIAKYFTEVYGLNNENASAVASIFGWMNLFARGAGGWSSDKANQKWGMRGRISVHSICLGFEGLLVILLPSCGSFAAALTLMILFSIFVQAAEGTTFGIVPYVDPRFPGSVSGIVSSGGNVGGIVFTSLFLFMEYNAIFYTLGICALVSVPLCLLLNVDSNEEPKDDKSIDQDKPKETNAREKSVSPAAIEELAEA